mgnify:CR=1 FL=1
MLGSRGTALPSQPPQLQNKTLSILLPGWELSVWKKVCDFRSSLLMNGVGTRPLGAISPGLSMPND